LEGHEPEFTSSGIIAPFALDGPIDRAFEVDVEKVLIPDVPPDAIVVVDNFSSDKGPRVRQMIEAEGAILLYLPSTTPTSIPIENAFAKLKALLRQVAQRIADGPLEPDWSHH